MPATGEVDLLVVCLDAKPHDWTDEIADGTVLLLQIKVSKSIEENLFYDLMGMLKQIGIMK